MYNDDYFVEMFLKKMVILVFKYLWNNLGDYKEVIFKFFNL